MSIQTVFDIVDLDRTQELKNKSEQLAYGSNSNPMTITTYSYVKMYKITQFSINVGIGSIQSYFASKYRPNIFSVPITVKATGIVTDGEMALYNAAKQSGVTGITPMMYTMQYSEFYVPCINVLGRFIDYLLMPQDRILVSIQNSQDEGHDILNIVHDTNMGKATKYNSANSEYTYNYKVYYPFFSRQGDIAGGYVSSLDGRVINLQINAQDKVYDLTKRMITFVP